MMEMSIFIFEVVLIDRFLGAHAMIIGGYGQFATGLASNPTPLAIRFQKAVREIRYGNHKEGVNEDLPVVIKCGDGETITADAVVVAVSLGVLKSKSIMFEPELPERKLGAISRLGFGLLNKVCFSVESLLTKGRPGLRLPILGCQRRFYRLSTNSNTR